GRSVRGLRPPEEQHDAGRREPLEVREVCGHRLALDVRQAVGQHRRTGWLEPVEEFGHRALLSRGARPLTHSARPPIIRTNSVAAPEFAASSSEEASYGPAACLPRPPSRALRCLRRPARDGPAAGARAAAVTR